MRAVMEAVTSRGFSAATIDQIAQIAGVGPAMQQEGRAQSRGRARSRSPAAPRPREAAAFAARTLHQFSTRTLMFEVARRGRDAREAEAFIAAPAAGPQAGLGVGGEDTYTYISSLGAIKIGWPFKD